MQFSRIEMVSRVVRGVVLNISQAGFAFKGDARRMMATC